MTTSRPGGRPRLRSALVTDPVPAPTSSICEASQTAGDAISLESWGELGASAPIVKGFLSSDRANKRRPLELVLDFTRAIGRGRAYRPLCQLLCVLRWCEASGSCFYEQLKSRCCFSQVDRPRMECCASSCGGFSSTKENVRASPVVSSILARCSFVNATPPFAPGI